MNTCDSSGVEMFGLILLIVRGAALRWDQD